MDRKKESLMCIDLKKGQGLELGPLYSPVVSKSEAKVFYVDHMSRESLMKKYKGHPFDVKKIVDVDFVVNDKTLKELVGNKKFDYVIASHVIEHIQDTISWLNDVSSILKVGGILSLVIPDKRYSFDIARELTKPADVIGAYIDKLQKSTAGMIYESISEYREITPMQAWQGKKQGIKKHPDPKDLKEAYKKAVFSRKEGEYVDAHCHVFTPYSFFQVLKRVMEHELIDFEVAYFKDTNLNELEFYVSLRKVKSKKNLLKSIPKIDDKESIQYVNRELNNSIKENEKLKQKIGKLEESVIAMHNSTSWKITKPIRKTKQIFQNKN